MTIGIHGTDFFLRGFTSNVTRPLERELSSGAVFSAYTRPAKSYRRAAVPAGTATFTRYDTVPLWPGTLRCGSSTVNQVRCAPSPGTTSNTDVSSTVPGFVT